MRFLSLVAGLVLIVGTAQANVKSEHFEAETVSSMQKLCMADEGTSSGKYAIGFCYGWIEGLGQFYEQLLIDERFDFEPSVCSEKELTREEVRAVFVSWAKAHPADAGRPAFSGLIDAMKEKFPCK